MAQPPTAWPARPAAASHFNCSLERTGHPGPPSWSPVSGCCPTPHPHALEAIGASAGLRLALHHTISLLDTNLVQLTPYARRLDAQF